MLSGWRVILLHCAALEAATGCNSIAHRGRSRI